MKTLKEIRDRFDRWFALREEREDRQLWLPNTLNDAQNNVVSKVSKVLDYDVGLAMAFAVAILEDTNAHQMAAEGNKLLLKMGEIE